MALSPRLKHLAYAAIAAGNHAFQTREPLDRLKAFLLLFYPEALGSAVHGTPLVLALRAAVSGAEIVVCTTGFGLEVLRGNPAVDRIVEAPGPNSPLLSRVRAIRSARPEAPYATILSASNKRPGLALAATLAGARNLVGFSLVPEFLRAPLALDPSISLIANDLRIVAALGHAAAPHTEPRVFFSAEDLAYARLLIGRLENNTKPLMVFVTQTNPAQPKSWRPERFLAVAQAMIARHGVNLLLVGAPGERSAVESLTRQIGSGACCVAGETNLSQLAALLSLCSAGLTLDTGILHMGRAVRLPMVIIAPAWSPPHEWLPLHHADYTILKNLDLPAAPPDYIIDEVSVEEVIEALDRLFASRAMR